MTIAKCLDLSTAHWPGPQPDFGPNRALSTKYGAVVWPTDLANTPDWLHPIVEVALAHDCIIINFDRDADMDDQFETFEW